jgi:hypothetical protein
MTLSPRYFSRVHLIIFKDRDSRRNLYVASLSLLGRHIPSDADEKVWKAEPNHIVLELEALSKRQIFAGQSSRDELPAWDVVCREKGCEWNFLRHQQKKDFKFEIALKTFRSLQTLRVADNNLGKDLESNANFTILETAPKRTVE